MVSLLRTSKETAEIYERNVDIVYRLCFVYLKNSADAEDAVHSIFMKLIESDTVFNTIDHEKAWLIVTTRNYCNNMLKHWWKLQRVDIENLPEIPYWDKDKGDEALSKLLCLPEKYKTVLYLYYYEGYSTAEIAKMLARNESTVRTQLCKGRERLKIDLGGAYSE